MKGYRANIVTYAFAKVVHDAEQLKRVVDLDQVWRLQRVPVMLERAFITAAEVANDVIANPHAGMRNISEWAKKQGCWAELAKRKVGYEPGFVDTLIDQEEARTNKREERKERQARSGVEAQREVVLQGAEYWQQVLAFGESIGKLDAKESGILKACTLPSSRSIEGSGRYRGFVGLSVSRAVVFMHGLSEHHRPVQKATTSWALRSRRASRLAIEPTVPGGFGATCWLKVWIVACIVSNA